jgi:hypothetical protein
MMKIAKASGAKIVSATYNAAHERIATHNPSITDCVRRLFSSDGE